MLVKYCKREHNILRRCRTIRLGTLMSYCADDPDFLRRDPEEGHFSVSKEPGIELTGKRAAEYTGMGWDNIEIASGAKVVRSESFPNCFIYCLSQTTPSIALARMIDPCYNDWFGIVDKNGFISRLGELLIEQMRLTDLELPSSVSFSDLGIHTFYNSVAYGGRHVVLDHKNFDEAIGPIRDPVRRLFLKPSGHQNIKEYRIAFVITDNDGRTIRVKTKAKNIQLMRSDPILSAVTHVLA
ncbi:MAG: hypothetical protein OXT72_05910 [Gammaproteobacteria bacterium]|nr:hypothetical protein [Gammaproteobacteria bacterium]MDE0246383.1 hypothetical protein [Gammaproteobacteria bacterium]